MKRRGRPLEVELLLGRDLLLLFEEVGGEGRFGGPCALLKIRKGVEQTRSRDVLTICDLTKSCGKSAILSRVARQARPVALKPAPGIQSGR